MLRKLKNRKGFTLMELVVSTAIMGTLASVAAPSFLETSEQAKGVKTIDNMSVVVTAVGQRLQELQGNYSDVNIVTNATAADVASATNIISYKKNGIDTYETFGDIFPGGVPTSSFDAQAYTYSSVAGVVAFDVSSDGSVDVTITTAPSLSLEDPRDANLSFNMVY